VDKEELEFRVEQLRPITEKVQLTAFEVLNGIKPVNELEKVLKEWEEKRQSLNNRNVGVLLVITQMGTVNFKLTGDPEKDMGQTNKSGKK